MIDKIFEFNNPNLILERHARNAVKRDSGTIAETIKHQVVHTPSPDSTIHHAVTAACPHPTRELEVAGKYYMVGYVSIPLPWLERITPAFAEAANISFVGPMGVIQRLPPILNDIEELLGERVYIGSDWSGLGEDMRLQPSASLILSMLTDTVRLLRFK